MPSFVLDKPNAAEDTYIFLLLTCADGRLKYSLKRKVKPSLWDSAAQRPIVEKKDDKAKALLLTLNRIYEAVERRKTTCEITGEPFTKKKAVQAIETVLPKKKPLIKGNFKKYSQSIIADMKSGAITTGKGKRYAASTVKTYETILKILLSFAADKKHSMDYEQQAMETYYAIIAYCNQKGYSLNFTGVVIKRWRSLLERAHEKGYHTNTFYESESFKALSEETYDISLSEEELRLLIKHNLSFNKSYDLSRDWFVIGCYTGLRASDLKRLNSKKVAQGQILLSNKKTGERVVLPLHPDIEDIIKKYDGGFPPPIAEQTINEKIKQVAEIAGIKGLVLYSVTEGGSKKDYYFQKWEMVSLHTARRSFITNARKNGVPDSVVMKLTGIKKTATLIRYDKLSAEEAAQIAGEHDFYKRKA